MQSVLGWFVLFVCFLLGRGAGFAARCAAILLAFVNRWIAAGLYVAVAFLWLIPDRRIERVLAKHRPGE